MGGSESYWNKTLCHCIRRTFFPVIANTACTRCTKTVLGILESLRRWRYLNASSEGSKLVLKLARALSIVFFKCRNCARQDRRGKRCVDRPSNKHRLIARELPTEWWASPLSVCLHAIMARVGQNRIYNICTVYDRIFGDFSAKNTVYTPYIYIWFWPTLIMAGSSQGCSYKRSRCKLW